MNHELKVVVLDREDSYDFISPLITETLKTSHITHFERIDDAVDHLQNNQRVDIAFCGWDIGGKYFINEMKKRPHLKTIPIVVMPETQTDSVIADVVRNRVADILPKPFTVQDFKERVRMIMMPLERRISFRIRPVEQLMVSMNFEDKLQGSYELMSLSTGGCQIRFPYEERHMISVYDYVMISLHNGGSWMELGSLLIRIEQDHEQYGNSKNLLLTIRFVEVTSEDAQELENIIADLSVGTKQEDELKIFRIQNSGS